MQVQLSGIDILEEDTGTLCETLTPLPPRGPQGIHEALPQPPLMRWTSPIWEASLWGALDVRSSPEVWKEGTLNKGTKIPQNDQDTGVLIINGKLLQITQKLTRLWGALLLLHHIYLIWPGGEHRMWHSRRKLRSRGGAHANLPSTCEEHD